VVAKTSMKSAWGPFVIQFLLPSMTHSSPCRVATVCMLLASEPLLGSVSPKQPSAAPEASLVSTSRF
jgi:hypothetical protein